MRYACFESAGATEKMNRENSSRQVLRRLKVATWLIESTTFADITKAEFDIGTRGLGGGKAVLVARNLRLLMVLISSLKKIIVRGFYLTLKPLLAVRRLAYRLSNHDKK